MSFGVGHKKARDIMISTKDVTLTFRKKRVPSTTENKANSTSSSGRGLKRKVNGTVLSCSRVLHLHNYFGVDMK